MTGRPHVVVSEFIAPEGIARLEPVVELVADATLVSDRARLLEAVAHADAIIVRDRTQVDAELLAAGPRLRAVGRLGVGTDNLDLDALAARDVVVHLATDTASARCCSSPARRSRRPNASSPGSGRARSSSAASSRDARSVCSGSARPHAPWPSVRWRSGWPSSPPTRP